MAIFPGVPGLAGCPLNSPSPSIPKLCVSVRVVNEKEWERRGPKALESRCRGGGVSPSQVGEGSGEGLCSPQKIFDFFLTMVHFDAFCVLVSRVKQCRKAVLCANCQLVSYLTWRTYHAWYIIHINTYIRVSNQPVRHTCHLYYG